MKDNSKLLLIGGLIFVIFTVLALIYLTNSNLSEDEGPMPSTPPNIESTGLEKETNPAEIKKMEESSNITQLLHKTPFYGKNFALFYSFDGNFFTLYINPGNQASGNAEFNQFLRQNGINNRSSFEDLRVVSISPTPEP